MRRMQWCNPFFHLRKLEKSGMAGFGIGTAVWAMPPPKVVFLVWAPYEMIQVGFLTVMIIEI
jgi:hypothetical protein